MSDTTEHDAISTFVVGLAEAASLVLKLEFPDKFPESSMQFMYAIKQASASADQLAQMQKNPAFWGIRDMLQDLTKKVHQMAVNNMIGRKPVAMDGKSPFIAVSTMLHRISEKGKEIATSKPLPRQQMLEVVDALEKARTPEEA